MNKVFAWAIVVAFIGVIVLIIVAIKNSLFKTDAKTYQANKTIHDIDTLKNFLIKGYFAGKEHFCFFTSFHIDPQTVLDLVTDKRYFPFHNKYQCQTTTYDKRRHSVDLKIEHTQGFKVFLALFDIEREDALSPSDKLVLQKIREISNNILTSSMSQFDKAKKVHDYLISTSSYDYENHKKNTIPDVSYTPYGLLLLHKAVCQAYAETFMIFMTLVGVECYMVIGNLISSTIGSNNHAWNIIKLNGKYGHVDVTNDNDSRIFGPQSQEFFFKSDEFMDKTHRWKLNHYPLCW